MWRAGVRAGRRAVAHATASVGIVGAVGGVGVFGVIACAAASAQTVAFSAVDGAVPQPLTDTPGDASRGRAMVANKQLGLCLLCHSGPFPEERFQGTLAPDLAGAGTRWSAAQLRLRIADSSRLNPDTVMPAYHRTAGLARVAPAWQGKPALTAQQVEDVVAFLQTLKAP